ncbi:MAG: sodium-dependent transporter [Halioglobus sp.]|nr:sodium-dependent transporter [Halioglobus sp.]
MLERPGVADRWGTRTTFVLALSTSAVGLGNLWRFSWLSGEYGGAAFVISYVICLFFIAVPIMVAEVVLGRYGGPGPVAAIRRACASSLRSRGWVLLGVLACVTGLLLLTFYVVVAGWSMAYADLLWRGTFSSIPAAEAGDHFARFLQDPAPQLYWQSLFLLLTAGVIVLGVRRGLGTLVWLVVPLMAGMLAFLVKFGFDHGDMAAAREFLFTTQLADFSSRTVLVALAHALFTLGVGVGTGISYGAYAPQRIPVGRSVMAVALFDVAIGLFAGLAVFPIVFANNLEPASGPGLLFISMPYAFGNLLQGESVGALFFALMTVAAWGTAVAIMEPIVVMLMQQWRLARFTASLLAGAVVWYLSLAVVVSLSASAPLPWASERNLLRQLDLLTAGVLLPSVALLMAILVGWRLHPAILRLELVRESDLFFSLWRGLLRYIAPPAIAILMLQTYFANSG